MRGDLQPPDDLRRVLVDVETIHRSNHRGQGEIPTHTYVAAVDDLPPAAAVPRSQGLPWPDPPQIKFFYPPPPGQRSKIEELFDLETLEASLGGLKERSHWDPASYGEMRKADDAERAKRLRALT